MVEVPKLSEEEWPEIRKGNFEFTAAKLVPNVRVTFAKMLTAGDPYCDIVFE